MLQKSYRILLKITKYEKDLQLFSHGTARFFSCEVLSRKNPPLESRNSPLNSAVKKNKPEVEKGEKKLLQIYSGIQWIRKNIYSISNSY